MKKLAIAAALALVLAVPTFAGEVPTGGKSQEPPPPTTTQSASTTTTTNVATAIILTIVNLIGG